MIVKPYLLGPMVVVIFVLWLRRDHYSRLGLVTRMAAFIIALVIAQIALTGSAGATPTIASLSPASGPASGGQQVTITGSNFVGQGGACNGGYYVWFGTDVEHGYAIVAPSYQVVSDTQLRVTVPPNAGGVVDVRVHNACGTSAVTGSDHYAYTYPSTQCVSGTCAVTISTAIAGPLGHVGEGFLDGFNTDAGVSITATERSLVQALHPRQWRLGQAGTAEPSGGEFGLARSSGAQISLDLTSDWQDWAYTHDRPYYLTPYDDLSTYSTFIANDVRQRITAGEVPDYFDVWNEPSSSGTVNQWLLVYGAAYRAIKSVDPSGQVVGPSIPAFLIASSGHLDQPGYQLSLTDFLNWEMSTGVRFAALSWHEDGTTVQGDPVAIGQALPGGYRDYWSPTAIADHVKDVKQLLTQYPALSATKLFVNEYGPTYAVNIPGWLVGDFSALESSGADQGMITCVTNSACNNLLDGLFGTDGQPQMPYWVVKAYAQMSGQRVVSQASGSNLYALASRNDTTRTLTALVGRADDCWGGQQCPQFRPAGVSAVTLNVSAAVPWGVSTVNVSVQPLRNSATNSIGSNDVNNPPAAVTSANVPVSCGTVKIPISSVGNGDAFAVTITAAPAGPASLRHAARAPRAPVANCLAYAARTRAASTRTSAASARTPTVSRRVTPRRTRTSRPRSRRHRRS